MSQSDWVPQVVRAFVIRPEVRGTLAAGLLVVLVLASLAFVAPMARGSNPHTCDGDGNITNLWCNGDFTTSSWSNDWSNVNVDQAACYTQSANSYSDSSSNGAFDVKEFTRADESSGCSTNVGEIVINPGTHGGSFSAWKSGYATYTVVANFTFNDDLGVGTYCASGGSPYTSAQIIAGAAMYDVSTGRGVGWASNGGGSNTSISIVCNDGQSVQDTSAAEQASFTTSVSVAQGDFLIPRGDVSAEVFASMPGNSPYSPAHAYSSLDFDNDGYGYITIDSIWVH